MLQVLWNKAVEVYSEEEVHALGLVPYNTRDLALHLGFFPKGPKQAEKLLQQSQENLRKQQVQIRYNLYNLYSNLYSNLYGNLYNLYSN